MLHGPQASAALGPPPGTRRMLAGGVLHVPQGPPSHFPVHPQKEGWMPPPPLMGQQERRFPRGTTGASPRPRDTAKTPLPGTLPPRTPPPPTPRAGEWVGRTPPPGSPGEHRGSAGPGVPTGYRDGAGEGGGEQTPLPPWRPSVAGPGRDDPPPVCGGSSPALQAPWRAALTRVVHHAGLAALRERPPCGETRTVKPTGTGTGTGTGSSTGTGMGQAGRDGRREERRGREEGGHAAAHRRRGRWSPHARPCRCRCRCRSRTRSARSPREEGPRVRSLGRRAAIEPARPPPRRAPPPSPGRRHLPRSSPASSLLPARPRAAILARRGCWGNAEHTPRPAVREPPPSFLRHL